MKLHLIPNIKGATKKRKRLGCGPGSHLGKTCGRGHKGGKARSGYSLSPAFEGGQMPLARKLPRRGFNNKRFSTEYTLVNLRDLMSFAQDGMTIDKPKMVEVGLARANSGLIKILGLGDLNVSIKVYANKFSNTAKQKIEAAGGSIEIV